MQNLTVVSVAFRQNKLINAAIGSVDKNLKSANVVKYLIIDNSAIVPFKIHEDICGKNAASKIEIVRNYVGYNRKIHFFRDHSHSRGILKAIELCETDLMLLIDHDIILKNDIDFIDDVVNDDVIGAFSLGNNFCRDIKMNIERVYPFLMLLNIAKLKKYNIKFYDDTYNKNRSHISYFTGYTFLQDIRKNNLKYKNINLPKYINHYFHAYAASQEKIAKFLNDNKQYYCNDIAACQIKKVELDITHVCNYKCKSCNRLCDMPNTNVDSTMTLDDVKQIVDQLKHYDVKELHVIGGEPCLNPEVYEICEYLCNELQKTTIIIISNGTCPQTIKKLKNIKNLKFIVKKENPTAYYKKWHINIFDERNIVHKNDYSNCFTLKYCGINIYKQNNKLLFAKCVNSMFITRLLGIEDKYAKLSLDELMNDFLCKDFYKDVCNNCACYSTVNLKTAKKYKDLEIVSEIFKSGLEKLKCYK